MADEPDYGKYTLAQLLDARRHIDESRFPERAVRLDREIASRPIPPQTPPALFRPSRVGGLDLTNRGVGTYLLLSGAVTLAMALDATIGRDGAGVLAYLAVSVFYGAMIVGGVCILKRLRIGPWIGFVALCLQIPFFRIGRLLYSVSAVPTLEFKLWPRFGFTITTGFVMNVQWLGAAGPVYLGLNATAGLFAVILANALARQGMALDRLTRMRAAGEWSGAGEGRGAPR